MNEQVIKFRVGVVLLTAGLVTAILLFYFTTVKDFFRRTYTIKATFPDAYGIAVNSPVRKSGVNIGRVTDVVLLNDTNDVEVTIKIYSDKSVLKNELPRIKLDSLVTGDSVLEFVKVTGDEALALLDANRDGRIDNEEAQAGKQPREAGSSVNGSTLTSDPWQVFVNLESRMTETFKSIQNASAGVKTAGTEVTQLMQSLNQTVSGKEDQIARIMQKSEQTLDVLQKTLQSIDVLVGDNELREKLKDSLGQFPAFITEARSTMKNIDSMATEFRQVAQKANTNLEHIERLTKPLGEKGDQIVRDIEQSVKSFETLFSELAQFADNLNNGEGSLAKFINDPYLYNEASEAVSNINEATQRIRPILEDLRIFSDKIAADPGVIGLRGALRKNAGLKYPQTRNSFR